MIVIIPCGSKKRQHETRAENLYVGSYFKMNLKWAKSVTSDEQIYILSAKHGLLKLNQKIKPYEQYMGKPGSISIETLQKQILALNLVNKTIIALGGSNYINALQKTGLQIKTPVAGFPMGKQIQLLKKNLGKIPQ